MMFAAAVAGYLLLFTSRVPKDVQWMKMKAKLKEVQDPPDYPVEEPEETSPKNFETVNASLRRAVEAGDHRAVLRSWNSLKQLNRIPSVPLSQIVESMQCVKRDSQYIVR